MGKKQGEGVGFERIRRVTGYLTRFERMNDGKQAEVLERVKHEGGKLNEDKPKRDRPDKEF